MIYLDIFSADTARKYLRVRDDRFPGEVLLVPLDGLPEGVGYVKPRSRRHSSDLLLPATSQVSL